MLQTCAPRARNNSATHTRASTLLLFLALLPKFTHAQTPTPPPAAPPPQQLTIRILNARTRQPITNERLNVSLREDQIGAIAMGTDKSGLILVDIGDATIVRILSNMYADCRPRAELYTNYSIATILSSGITTGNLCSSVSAPPKPGTLTLYEIPKTRVPTYPNPPVTNMPHSDENPHSNPN